MRYNPEQIKLFYNDTLDDPPKGEFHSWGDTYFGNTWYDVYNVPVWAIQDQGIGTDVYIPCMWIGYVDPCGTVEYYESLNGGYSDVAAYYDPTVMEFERFVAGSSESSRYGVEGILDIKPVKYFEIADLEIVYDVEEGYSTITFPDGHGLELLAGQIMFEIRDLGLESSNSSGQDVCWIVDENTVRIVGSDYTNSGVSHMILTPVVGKGLGGIRSNQLANGGIEIVGKYDIDVMKAYPYKFLW